MAEENDIVGRGNLTGDPLDIRGAGGGIVQTGHEDGTAADADPGHLIDQRGDARIPHGIRQVGQIKRRIPTVRFPNDAEHSIAGMNGGKILEEADSGQIVRGIITAQEHDIRLELIHTGDQIIQIHAGIAEAVMNVRQINHTQAADIRGEAVTGELMTIRGDHMRFQERPGEEQQQTDQEQNQPPTAMGILPPMTAAGADRGSGGDRPGLGSGVLAAVFFHGGHPPSLTASVNEARFGRKARIQKFIIHQWPGYFNKSAGLSSVLAGAPSRSGEWRRGPHQ